jgi:hypothetical protein
MRGSIGASAGPQSNHLENGLFVSKQREALRFGPDRDGSGDRIRSKSVSGGGMKFRVNKNTRTGEQSANPGVVGNYFAVRDVVGPYIHADQFAGGPEFEATILRLSSGRHFATFAP